MINDNVKSVAAHKPEISAPKFKGKTTIELFENGNKVGELVEENMMTSFVQKVFNPPRLYNMSDNGYKLFNDNMPIYNNLLGGLLLYAEPIEENADNLLVSVANECIGHAGSAYSGTNKRRGSYNANESGFIDAEKPWLGYRHVWDFGTDKANGTISCACLTSKVGGNSGFGGGISYTVTETNNVFAEGRLNGINGNVIGDYSRYSNLSFRYLGAFDGVDKFVYLQSSSKLVLLEVPTEKMNINLADSISDNRITWKTANASVNTPSVNISIIDLPFILTSIYSFSVFVNNKELFIVNQHSNSGFDYAVFNPITKTFGEVQSRTVEPAYQSNLVNNLCFANEYWFARSANSKLVRYTSGGGQGEEFGELPFYHNSCQPLGSDVLFMDLSPSSSDSYVYIVNTDNPELTMFRKSKVDASDSSCQVSPDDSTALLSFNLSNSNGAFSVSVNRLSGCMASINNLETPITKTSAQTMKITYEITAEEVE